MRRNGAQGGPHTKFMAARIKALAEAAQSAASDFDLSELAVEVGRLSTMRRSVIAETWRTLDEEADKHYSDTGACIWDGGVEYALERADIETEDRAESLVHALTAFVDAGTIAAKLHVIAIEYASRAGEPTDFLAMQSARIEAGLESSLFELADELSSPENVLRRGWKRIGEESEDFRNLHESGDDEQDAIMYELARVCCELRRYMEMGSIASRLRKIADGYVADDGKPSGSAGNFYPDLITEMEQRLWQEYCEMMECDDVQLRYEAVEPETVIDQDDALRDSLPLPF